MFLTVIAAFLDTVYTIGTRKLLAYRKHVSYGTFFVELFFFLALISWGLWGEMGELQAGFWQFKYIIILLVMVTVGVTWNILYYKGLHQEQFTEFEIITMTEPIITIFLAAVLIPKEFNLNVFIAGIVASSALVLSHIKRKHIAFNKNQRSIIWAVFLMAVESVLSRWLLDVMSPISLYAIRCSLMFFGFSFIFRHHLKEIRFNRMMFFGFLLALLAVSFKVLVYKSFISIGVGFTVLIMLLSPIFDFIWAHYEEHERVPWKKFIAAGVIIAAIAYANFVR